MVTLDEQIQAVAEAMLQLQSTNRNALARKQISQEEATLRMDHLQAAQTTLSWLKANEAAIKRKVEP